MNNPLVSIVIPTYNRKLMLVRLVESILSGDYKNIEIVIIDDASADGTYEFLNKKYYTNKKIKIIRNKKNLFAAGSKNVGQKNATGELIMFIDDDNIVDKKMISELVEIFINSPGIGEVGPINYSLANKSKVLFCGADRNMWTTKTNHKKSLTEFNKLDFWETDDIPNAFMVRGDVIRKNKIEFNVKFGIMYEESDYAYRIKKAGYKVFMVKKAKIYHDIEDELTNKNYLLHFLEDSRRSFTFARNRIIFHSKYSTKPQIIGIYLFWIWVFTVYYSYKFLSYDGYGKFNTNQKLKSIYKYFSGNISGYRLVLTKNEFIR